MPKPSISSIAIVCLGTVLPWQAVRSASTQNAVLRRSTLVSEGEWVLWAPNRIAIGPGLVFNPKTGKTSTKGVLLRGVFFDFRGRVQGDRTSKWAS
jgi:hypothetical protein